MKFSFWRKRGLALVLCAALLPQMFACGTILYPERHGRQSGQIDIAVALMDGIGLLFFIIPGVVAYAVDFHTGAIYLPKGHPNLRKSDGPDSKDVSIKVVRVNPEILNAELITGVVFRETGHPVRFDDPKIIIKQAGPGVRVEAELKKMLHLNGESHKVLARK